jgi:hypothetical protein
MDIHAEVSGVCTIQTVISSTDVMPAISPNTRFLPVFFPGSRDFGIACAASGIQMANIAHYWEKLPVKHKPPKRELRGFGLK